MFFYPDEVLLPSDVNDPQREVRFNLYLFRLPNRQMFLTQVLVAKTVALKGIANQLPVKRIDLLQRLLKMISRNSMTFNQRRRLTLKMSWLRQKTNSQDLFHHHLSPSHPGVGSIYVGFNSILDPGFTRGGPQ